MLKKAIVFIFCLLLFCSQASFSFAYIDPGTAGTIIGGGLWGFIVLVASAIALFFSKKIIRPLRRFFARLFSKKK